MFRTGYILTFRQDLFWFLTLPFLALAIGLGCQSVLPYVAIASVNLWITIPHHCATWLRTYGSEEDWQRFKKRLIIGPAAIFGMSLMGTYLAPITLLLLVSLWDHQHSIMQQHGFARIYDFKAATGTRKTARLDLTLHWILYGNMFLNAPLFSTLWLRELHRLHVPVSGEVVNQIQNLSWVVTFGYLLIYAAIILYGTTRGEKINPIKYWFIASSYFLWYFAAWHTHSVLVYGIAHRIMHGCQYIVMVHSYMQRKIQNMDHKPGFWFGLAATGRTKWFIMVSFLYALIYQFLLGAPLDDFGFGVVNFVGVYGAIPELGIPALTDSQAFQLYAEAITVTFAMTHYYVDSFIWKVRDKKVQGGL